MDKLWFHRRTSTHGLHGLWGRAGPRGPPGSPAPRPPGAHEKTGTHSFDPWLMLPHRKAHSCYFCNMIEVPFSCSATLPVTCTLWDPEARKEHHVHQQPATEGLFPKQSQACLWCGSANPWCGTPCRHFDAQPWPYLVSD